MSRVVGLMCVTAIVAACASSRNLASRQARCPLTVRDSVFLTDVPVYRDCAVERKAKLIETTARLDYRPTKAGCSTVELEMVVDPIGLPEAGTIHVVRTNDQGLADAVLASVRNWRFEPATIQETPVRQIVNTSRTVSMIMVVVPAGQSPTGAANRASPRPPKC